MESPNPLLTTEEVARYLNIEVITVRRLVQRGELAAYRIGGEYRFAEADLQDFLHRQYVPIKKSADDISILFPKAIRDHWNELAQPARQTLLYASEEARQYSQSIMEPEHLLVGLVLQNETVAGRVLAELGLTVDRARLAAQSVTQAGKRREKGLTLTMSATALQALDAAISEAQQLSHAAVTTEHLLLGLLAYENAGTILNAKSADVREAVQRLMREDE